MTTAIRKVDHEVQLQKQEGKKKELVVKGHTRKKKRSKDEMWKDLPIEEVVHEVENKDCPFCGTKWKLSVKNSCMKNLSMCLLRYLEENILPK